MLRRRKKGPRPDKHPAAQVRGPRSRRRAREDAAVPPQLIVPPELQAELLQPPAVPRAQPDAAPRPRAQPKAKAPRPGGRGKARAPEPAPQAGDIAPTPAGARPEAEAVVLVTAFEPFCGERINPSWEICSHLPQSIAGLRVSTCRVPCEFRRAIEVVAAAIELDRPALVVSLGQAGGRSHLSVERVAINVDDAAVADNAGMQPVDEAIAANGPPAYFSTLPVKAMAAAMRAAGVPAVVSNTAGTYVCNHLMYGVLHYLAASGSSARAGFIHVPYAEEQVLDRPGTPALAIATMVRGVEAAIAAAQEHTSDIAVCAGTLD